MTAYLLAAAGFATVAGAAAASLHMTRARRYPAAARWELVGVAGATAMQASTWLPHHSWPLPDWAVAAGSWVLGVLALVGWHLTQMDAERDAARVVRAVEREHRDRALAAGLDHLRTAVVAACRGDRP